MPLWIAIAFTLVPMTDSSIVWICKAATNTGACEAVPMIGNLIDGADLCMGSRFKGEIKPGAMPWKNRYIGNPVLSAILRLLFKTRISDSHCGLRAIRREVTAL